MIAFAPGKLVLTGAYAVLEGAPAIAVAVSRGAYADDASRSGKATPEVRAALGDVAPAVDASAMFAGDRKLGLGASAAILVASLAAVADAAVDLSSASVRDALFTRARNAHASAQGGGSGVDIAASVHGGAIHYVVGKPVKRVALPAGLRMAVFACGTSARTSDLRAEISRLESERPDVHRLCMSDLVAIAWDAANSIERNDMAAFIAAHRRTARALDALGKAAGCAIVPNGFDELEGIANADGGSFCVSGAGGGDVAVWLGSPSSSSSARRVIDRATALGLTHLDDISIDTLGVRAGLSISSSGSTSSRDQHTHLAS